MTGTPDQDEPETRDVCGITAHAMLYQKNAEALNGTKPCVTSRARCAGRALTRSSAVPDSPMRHGACAWSSGPVCMAMAMSGQLMLDSPDPTCQSFNVQSVAGGSRQWTPRLDRRHATRETHTSSPRGCARRP
jgi:hypothetical protein